MSGFANIQLAISPSPPSGTVVAFTASASWVVPPGVFSIDALLVGGGGSGGGFSGSPVIPAGGGSGGSVVEALGIAVTPGDTLDIFVGTGATYGNYDASGSDIEAPGAVVLAFAPPGTGSNSDNSSEPYGNGGGASCASGVPSLPGGGGGVNGFAGGAAISDDVGSLFFINGGGGGAGQQGADGVGPATGGKGGNGRDMSAGWGTTYGENGVFGGGGGGNGYQDPSLLGPGAKGLGTGPNTGGGSSSDILGPQLPGDSGIVLIRY